MPGNTPWTPAEVEILLRDYPSIGSRRCAEKLGRTPRAVKLKFDKLMAKERGEKPERIDQAEFGEHSLGSQHRPVAIITRRCHDCHKPTPDYRCQACLDKLLAKHPHCYGPTADERYGVTL